MSRNPLRKDDAIYKTAGVVALIAFVASLVFIPGGVDRIQRAYFSAIIAAGFAAVSTVVAALAIHFYAKDDSQ